MAECTPMTPKAPERPRMAAAAVARMPRSRRLGTREAPLAGPLPDDDRLVAGEHVAGEALLVGGDLGADLEADRRRRRPCGVPSGCSSRMAQCSTRRVSVSTRTVSSSSSARSVARSARPAEARHRRLAVGALALGGGAPRLGLGALALGDDALAVGAAELARELVDDRGDDDDRRRRQQPPAQLAGVEAPVGERDARADEPEDREHGLERGLAQAEVDRVRA